MNSNTIRGYLSGTGVNQIAAISTNSTGATTAILIPLNTNAGTTTAILAVPQQGDIVGSSTALSPNVNQAFGINNRGRVFYSLSGQPGYNTASFDAAHPFKLRLSGIFALGTNTTASQLIIPIYQGVNSTTISTLSLASTIPTAAGTGNGSFVVECEFAWDSTSQILMGKVQSYGNFSTTNGVAANVVNGAASITAVTGITTPANLSFLAGAYLKTATGALTTAQLTCQFTEFALEEI